MSIRLQTMSNVSRRCGLPLPFQKGNVSPEVPNDDRPIAVNRGPSPIVTDDDPAIGRIYSLTASRNIETVKCMIRAKYQIEVTDAYAADLITFVIALTDGQ